MAEERNQGRRMTDQLQEAVAQATRLAGIEQEVKNATKSIDELKTEAIAPFREELKSLDKKLEKWFDESEHRFEERLKAMETNRIEWQRVHMDRNDREFEKTNELVRVMREKYIRVFGWATGVGSLVTVLIAVSVTFLNFRFAELKDSVDKNEVNTDRNDQRDEKQTEAIHQIELYLARLGMRPTTEARRNDEQRK